MNIRYPIYEGVYRILTEHPVFLVGELLPYETQYVSYQPFAPIQVVLGKEFCLFATSEEEIIFRVCIPVLPFNLCQGRLFVASDEIRVIVRYVLSGNQHLPSYKKVGVMEIVLVQHSVPA
ncbi:hypothetical protein [Dialister invisus]|uniref:hypothetical protein n=1 Tax=Dialister invisus TaxID=218538 RepID=UPI003AADE570